MDGRFTKESAGYQPGKGVGAVITISREAGCSGNYIAEELVNKFNDLLQKMGRESSWNVINKEIIEDAARKLELHPDKVKDVLKAEKRSHIDEMILSMATRYYKSDKKIRKTIRDVIKSFVNTGNVIIVGRAGVVMAKDHPRSIHIKLRAPIDWRKKVISEKHNISLTEAEKYIVSVDKSRTKLIRDYRCKNPICLFDISINCSRFSNDEIIEMIRRLMESKKYI